MSPIERVPLIIAVLLSVVLEIGNALRGVKVWMDPEYEATSCIASRNGTHHETTTMDVRTPVDQIVLPVNRQIHMLER